MEYNKLHFILSTGSSTSTQAPEKNEIVILTATSGDTGKAALAGASSVVKDGLYMLSDNWPNVYQFLGVEDFLQEYS